jgi:hypothetical protein
MPRVSAASVGARDWFHSAYISHIYIYIYIYIYI